MKRILLLFTLALASVSCSTDKDEQVFKESNKHVLGHSRQQYVIRNSTNSDILVRLILLPKFVTDTNTDLIPDLGNVDNVFAHMGLIQDSLLVDTYFEIPAGLNYYTDYDSLNSYYSPEDNDSEINDDYLFSAFLYRPLESSPVYQKFDSNARIHTYNGMYRNYKIYFAEYAIKDDTGNYDLDHMTKIGLYDKYLLNKIPSFPNPMTGINMVFNDPNAASPNMTPVTKFQFELYESDPNTTIEAYFHPSTSTTTTYTMNNPRIAYYKSPDYPYLNSTQDNNGNTIYGRFGRGIKLTDYYELDFRY
ncbi:MAG: hypothetical protein LBE34_12565 [Flavobacteriaceae bacterium]|jgi:hypothetical protein|nr:hypothetical protein [Flavobacteriaceae bacterium]